MAVDTLSVPNIEVSDSGDSVNRDPGAVDNPQTIRIGVISGFTAAGDPVVKVPGWLQGVGLPSRTTADVSPADLGSEVVVAIGESQCQTPIILGILKARKTPSRPPAPIQASVDGERVTLSADKEIVLRCGAASITLTRAGKVIIRGAHILSRSTGANKIKGASVEIN
jgi:hypothetical protein